MDPTEKSLSDSNGRSTTLRREVDPGATALGQKSPFTTLAHIWAFRGLDAPTRQPMVVGAALLPAIAATTLSACMLIGLALGMLEPNWSHIIITVSSTLLAAVATATLVKPSLASEILLSTSLLIASVVVAVQFGYAPAGAPLTVVGCLVFALQWGTRAAIVLLTIFASIFWLGVNSMLASSTAPNFGLSNSFGVEILYTWSWSIMVLLTSCGMVQGMVKRKLAADELLLNAQEAGSVQRWLLQSVKQSHGDKVMALASAPRGLISEQTLSSMREIATELLQSFTVPDGQTLSSGGPVDDDVDEKEENTPLQTVSLLVVDDDPVTLRANAMMLRAWGARVITAVSASEVLFKLTQREQIDLILCDYYMPHMGGMELAAALAHRPEAPPLALLTGSFSADQSQEALATGALGIYAKPLTLETARSLASLVKKMLSEKPKKHFSQPGDGS